ncbi:KpsF/GutQ family sugar-phosphate isomerase [Corticibacter populi]|uniref:KpsF/GutQ family sugar-phosphate isomerase n=1 Tax=Corticibacter populi TaxID=1550736 RepID=A0A3M6QMG4_9BURK|nr:KpsF/GutQ family sugar-phosphate isomerase [Corticibacter populi]RMX04270.1 KpsF/GutQ family sugar-phosphate isomerase [Corticibacter populi]RZS33313.1 arabinose-5-phosphate isomerase [Corticibacter populi]
MIASPPLADKPANFDGSRAQDIGRRTIQIEIEQLQALYGRLDGHFAQAVACMLRIQGRVIVTGMGKSGHVGRKIAATLSSTGTPSFFLHPAEASHGDLGMVTAQDVVLAISNSGASEELVGILPIIKRLGAPIIAITGKLHSALALHADIVLDSRVDQEADPLNLAPTASTTVQLALGDALAIALADARGFRTEDFARSHPGGALGRRLLTHVGDVMRSGDDVPRVGLHAGFGELVHAISAKGMGATAVVDAQGHVAGIYTDGDLRRHIEAGVDLRQQTAGELMHPAPRTIAATALAAQAAELMERHHITSLLVTDEQGVLIGAVHVGDLMRAKVI